MYWDVDRYLKETEKSISDGNISHAIWLIENAYASTVKGDQSVVIDAFVDARLPKSCLAVPIEDCLENLNTISKMLTGSSSLISEEWMLVVSELSCAYALMKFMNRKGEKLRIPALDAVIAQLAEATSNYTYVPFLKQVAAARQRHPNPLPPPL